MRMPENVFLEESRKHDDSDPLSKPIPSQQAKAVLAIAVRTAANRSSLTRLLREEKLLASGANLCAIYDVLFGSLARTEATDAAQSGSGKKSSRKAPRAWPTTKWANAFGL